MKKLDNFTNSLNALRRANFDRADDEIYRSGIISTFSMTLELSWKALQAVLREHGVAEAETGSPREILKLGFKYGFVGEQDVWIDMLNKRNELTHIYNEESAKSIIPTIYNKYIPAFSNLEYTLYQKVAELNESKDLDLTEQEKGKGL